MRVNVLCECKTRSGRSRLVANDNQIVAPTHAEVKISKSMSVRYRDQLASRGVPKRGSWRDDTSEAFPGCSRFASMVESQDCDKRRIKLVFGETSGNSCAGGLRTPLDVIAIFDFRILPLGGCAIK